MSLVKQEDRNNPIILSRAARWGVSVEEAAARVEANKRRNEEEARLGAEKRALMEEAQFTLLDLDRLGVEVSPELRLALYNAGSRKCDLEARRQAVAEGRALLR